MNTRLEAGTVLDLQRSVGNQVVNRLISPRRKAVVVEQEPDPEVKELVVVEQEPDPEVKELVVVEQSATTVFVSALGRPWKRVMAWVGRRRARHAIIADQEGAGHEGVSE
jgi:hypothetical protein